MRLAKKEIEDTIKLCDEIIEKVEQIKSTTFWLKQCAKALHTKMYDNQLDRTDDNNNYTDYAYRLQRFADDLATIADQIIPGTFITNDE